MSNIKLWRVIAAFCVAPLVVPITFYLAFFDNVLNQELSGLLSTILTYGPYSYAIALFTGIPLFLLFKRKNQLKVHYFLASGLLIGAVVGLLLSSLTVDPMKLILLCGVSGLIASVVFWLLIKPESQSE